MATTTKSTVSIVEHAVLFKFKTGYTAESEHDMYAGLWSFKEHFPSIMAMSLGRVLAEDPHGATHVLVMRFASQEALNTYMDDDYRIEISYKTIVPFFNGEYTLDFEADVDSDLSELYKEGEKFNNGVDHVELYKFKESTSTSEIEEFMAIVADLPNKAKAEIVQLTSGTNFKPKQIYSHGCIVRLQSSGLEAFINDPAHEHMLKEGESILEDFLSTDFIVNESKNLLHEGPSAYVTDLQLRARF